MIIEGKIKEVMESWPLQLSIDTESGPQKIRLHMETNVKKGSQMIDAGELKPNQQVRIDGEASGPNSVKAHSIEIISNGD